jgi:hypothetical protein
MTNVENGQATAKRQNAPAHMSLKATEFVCNNMFIVPHPAYSPDLGPCDFALLLKLKMKLKGQRFETVSDIQRESQAALDSIKQNAFHDAFGAWKGNDLVALYVPKDVIFKEMAAKF